METVRRAVGLGVNWTDTAANYGLEHSEEVVGRAIKELPGAERPLVFTRGLVTEASNHTTPTDRTGLPEFVGI